MKPIMPPIQALIALAFFAATILISGCGGGAAEAPSSWEPMGASAPKFEGDELSKKVAEFAVGRWCLCGITNLDFEGQPKVFQTKESTKPDPKRWWQFEKDGTFTCGNDESGWKLEGKYAADYSQISLSYDTMDGRPVDEVLPAYMREHPKTEKEFRQLRQWNILKLDGDKKRFYFLGSAPSKLDPTVQRTAIEAKGLQRLQPVFGKKGD